MRDGKEREREGGGGGGGGKREKLSFLFLFYVRTALPVGVVLFLFFGGSDREGSFVGGRGSAVVERQRHRVRCLQMDGLNVGPTTGNYPDESVGEALNITNNCFCCHSCVRDRNSTAQTTKKGRNNKRKNKTRTKTQIRRRTEKSQKLTRFQFPKKNDKNCAAGFHLQALSRTHHLSHEKAYALSSEFSCPCNSCQSLRTYFPNLPVNWANQNVRIFCIVPGKLWEYSARYPSSTEDRNYLEISKSSIWKVR